MNSAGQENLKLGEIQSFKMRLTVIRLQSLMLSKPNVNQYREILKWFSNWCSYQNGLSAIFPIKMRVYLRQCSNCMVLADFALDLIDSNMCLYLCIYNTTSWLFNSMVSGWILCTLHVKDRQQYQFKHETLQKKKNNTCSVKWKATSFTCCSKSLTQRVQHGAINETTFMF